MTIRIHPPQPPETYAEALLALLVEAALPQLQQEALQARRRPSGQPGA